jgi:dihydrofolate synthase/folylpolyglutamate synthase
MINTYPEAVEYLYANLPIFQRVGAVAYKKDISNTIRLCEILGNPQMKFKSVHVAGTNGKGSSSHMLASVLQEAGYKTGLYTSPHLKSFTERIRINGADISEEFVIDFVNRIQPAIEEIKPSFFEITVAMAFDYFVSQNIDVAVIEVGLGGRLDSTNIITPIVSLITNIGWDHKDILGDSLELIASEKAGIIKSKIPAVISQRQQEIQNIFIDRARDVGADIYFASDDFSAKLNHEGNFDLHRDGKKFLNDVDLPLKGLYQEKNLPGVLKTIEVLNRHGFPICVRSM